jgi:hypothetical protein
VLDCKLAKMEIRQFFGNRKTVLQLTAVAIITYFGAMYWLSISYDPTIRRSAMPGVPGETEIIRRPYEPLADSKFAVRGYDLYFKDDADKEHSRVTVYEDDRPLGPSHSTYDQVYYFGMGRYAHTKNSFIFSSSDNTDPNTNGRTYWARRAPK